MLTNRFNAPGRVTITGPFKVYATNYKGNLYANTLEGVTEFVQTMKLKGVDVFDVDGTVVPSLMYWPKVETK